MSQKLLSDILQSEKSILSRTDQKAYTMLSILGVFMVFFIVSFRLIEVNIFIFVMLSVYFTSAFIAIYHLIRTMMPRVEKEFLDEEEEHHKIDPTFFGGIKEFSNSMEYHDYIMEVIGDDERMSRLLSRQIHTIAKINWIKNMHLRKGMYFFVSAITVELMMILSTFLKKTYFELFS